MTTILVVDDSDTVRKMVEFVLKTKGYAVEGARDGLDALERLERETYDLVILDVNMPRISGVKFLETVRSEPCRARPPVLILTTEGQERDRDRALAAGADDYMSKPFKPTELLARVGKLLR